MAHESNLTPHTAIAFSAAITFCIPAMLTLAGLKPFDSMGYLGTMSTYGFLLVYSLVSIAAPVYLYRLGKLRPLDVVFAMLGVGFMMIPILGMVGIPGSDLFPVPEAPYNVFPYLFLLYLTAGCGWFMIQRIRYPKLLRRMQREIDAIHLSYSNSDR